MLFFFFLPSSHQGMKKKKHKFISLNFCLGCGCSAYTTAHLCPSCFVLACCLLYLCPSVKYWFGILYIYRYDAQQLYIESQSHYAPSGREYRMVIGRLHGWSLLHNLFPISFVRFSFVSFSIFYSILLFLWCYSTDLLIASLGVTKRTQPYI